MCAAMEGDSSFLSPQFVLGDCVALGIAGLRELSVAFCGWRARVESTICGNLALAMAMHGVFMLVGMAMHGADPSSNAANPRNQSSRAT
jgi:hypothetical protein